MKLCAVQLKPVKGDIAKNIERHLSLIELAVSDGADIIIFPELSLTGYEPSLAKQLATTIEDARLDTFQTSSDTNNITIGVGMPLRNKEGISISMIIFQPHQKRETYSKLYIHADEEAFFVGTEGSVKFLGDNNQIALSICYELSVPAHSANAHQHGAAIYLSSVAKTPKGVDKAIDSLAEIAARYSMMVLMSNCIGVNDGEVCGGKSSAWNSKGQLLGQLDDNSEGILILDTATQHVFSRQL